MAMPIMPTKLTIPPPRRDLVARARLLDRLDAGLQAGRRLTVVAAPAGSGKTTLVTAWLYSPTRPVATRAVAWLSLDDDDNDPARFLIHLIAALRQIAPRVGRGAESLLGTPQMPSLSALMPTLMADLAQETVPGLVVLDEYQAISSVEIHEAMERFLAYQPAHLHLVVISRAALPFSLSTLRVRDGLTEIDARDLRFTPAEATAFLRQALGPDVTDEAAHRALDRTEGWAAGLQLLALAARRQGRAGALSLHADAVSLSASAAAPYVADYLVAEVLSQQPPEIRDFLRATSILDHLSGSLCDHVARREGSATLLARLAAAGLFVVPLDAAGQWYRYHRLFAEMLMSTLAPGEREDLHRRAVTWYEEHGIAVRAVQHALACGGLGGDWSLAEGLIRRYGEETARRGEMAMVQGWIDALPRDRVDSDPHFVTLKAWISAMSGDLNSADDASRRAAALVAAASAPTETSAVCGKLQALRSFIVLLKDGDNVRATAHADQALRDLPADAVAWRVLAYWSRAEAQERLNNLPAAVEALWEAQRLGRAMRETLFAVVAEGGLVKLLNDQGRRREALVVCEEALAHYRDGDGELLPLAGYIYSQLGMLHYEANDLDAARVAHDRALELGQALGLDYELVYQRAMAAPTWYAGGEVDRALAALRDGYRHAREAGYADADWFLAWETNIHLAQGDLVFARHWAERAALSPQDEPRLLRIEQHITYARFLIIARRMADARLWLARLAAFTREHDLRRWGITVDLLRATVVDRLGDREAALSHVAQAVSVAAPEGYVRPFLVEDPRLLALLDELRHIAPIFVDRVRDAAELGDVPYGLPEASLVEPLTDRELEVVRLMAAGATNREIADRLVIAVGTVKRHTNHIYGKLQVHNRTEAVGRARELGLL